MTCVISCHDVHQNMGYMVSTEIAKRLQAVIDTAIDGIITIDHLGVMESVNKSAGELFGYAPEELLGKKVNILMNDHDKAHHDQYLDNYTTTRKPKIIGIGREVVGLKKNGDHFTFRLAVSEVALNDRTIFTGIIHDLSDVQEAKKRVDRLNAELEDKVEERTLELESVVNKLLKTNEELEKRELELADALKNEQELNELKSRFVSMASHEFRTPLSTILSSASLISRYTESDQQTKRERHIVKIKNSVDHLTSVLNDFLSLGKLEEGEVRVQKESVNIRELVIEIADGLKGILKEDQKINYTSEDNGSIHSDPKILTNILFNLLSNAIKYSGVGSVITVSCNRTDQGVHIYVQDQGIGIPLEDQKFLFSRFFRANNVENIQGTGLGLHIVQNYVELLKGEIGFESQPGKGSKFYINIPS